MKLTSDDSFRADSKKSATGVRRKGEAGAEGSGFRSAGLPLGLGGGHGLAGDRRATRVNSLFVSIPPNCEISFSRDDFKSCLPRIEPAPQTCEMKYGCA